MSVDDRLYQVWGNSYADRGNDRKAEKIYRRGLKAFPHSGALHMELGALAFKDKRYDEALMYFERGIELDPSYPDNYWRAAGIYLSSPESVWGMIYGEIYMNMVCNGEQNMEVSRLLAEAYDSNIWHEKNDRGQDLIYISFSENNSIWYDETLKVMRFPYGVAVYEPTLGNAVVKGGAAAILGRQSLPHTRHLRRRILLRTERLRIRISQPAFRPPAPDQTGGTHGGIQPLDPARERPRSIQ
ncbi:MAG: tetratricopeptide repeat protein [Bacteroidales bacterium]|nr:MAG: tetratricopeptide repeat protein [Bacteroidales bacterium]